MKRTFIYRENKTTGKVDCIEATNYRPEQRTELPDYHQGIINTYYELECSGQLRDMSAREKRQVRDVHIHAQNPAYWPDGNFGNCD